MNSVLLVSFDLIRRKNLSVFLSEHGFEVFEADSVKSARDLYVEHSPRVVISERELPDGSGFLFAKYAMNASDCGAILWASDENNEVRLHAYRQGFDHFVSYDAPYEMFVYILQNLMRRLPKHLSKEYVWFCYRDDGLLISPNGVQVNLTQTELKVMCLFVEKTSQVVSKDDFALALDKTNVSGFEKNLKVVINRLRNKVLEKTEMDLPIRSIRHVGYRFISKISFGLV